VKRGRGGFERGVWGWGDGLLLGGRRGGGGDVEIDYGRGKNRRLVSPVTRMMFEKASALHDLSQIFKQVSLDELPI